MARKIAVAIVAAMVCGLLLVAALGLLLASAFFAIERVLGPSLAALLTAGAAVGIVLLVVMFTAVAQRRKHRSREVIAAEFVGHHPLEAAGAALAAGFIASNGDRRAAMMQGLSHYMRQSAG